MSNFCINPNDPEFKKLVAQYGEAMSRVAVDLNGGEEIPSIEKAKELFKLLNMNEKDEQDNRKGDSLKLLRIEKQLEFLEKLSKDSNVNYAQLETLSKIIKMNREYKDFLLNNIALKERGETPVSTIATSVLIGSSEFKEDAVLYENFKLFGTFMHEVLELTQEQSLKDSKSIDEILTFEKFNEMYENFLKVSPFFIEELDLNTMYEMSVQIVKKISANYDECIILPEITITGRTKSGTVTVGRLDLVLIDTQGRVKILDFKTKKVRDLMETKDGVLVPNKNRAFNMLAGINNSGISSKEGTIKDFQQRKRTTYDTWTLQLQAYSNMLKQSDITVDNQSEIIALIYQTDPNLRYMGSMVHRFNELNFYNYAKTSTIIDPSGHWVKELTSRTKQLVDLKEILDRELPYGDYQPDEIKKKKILRNLEFDPTKEQNELLKLRLKSILDSQLSKILSEIRDLKFEKNPEKEGYLKLLTIRQETLKTINDILDKPDIEDSMIYSTNLALTMDALNSDFSDIAEVSSNSILEYRTNRDLNSKEVNNILKAFVKSRELADLLQVVKNIISESRINNPAITENSDVLKKLSVIESNNNQIESNFREIGIKAGSFILKSIGKSTFQKVDEQLKQALEVKIKILEKELEAMKSGKAASIFQGLKSSMLTFISKEHKEKLKQKLSDPNSSLIVDIENKERQILAIQQLLDSGLQYTDESLEKYINGVTDESSVIYMGSNVFNPDSFLQGRMFDSLIASSSNADITISSFTQLLKNQEAKARLNIMNSFAVLQFEKKKESLLKRYTVESLNDKISEWRLDKSYNPQTKTLEDRNSLYLTKPFSLEYEQTYRSYNDKLREFKNEIKELRKERNNNFKTNLKQATEDAYLEKIKEKDDYNNEYIQWLLDNTSLPFTSAFYELQKKLPSEIRDALQKKYLEIETITYNVGKGNELMLDEDDFDRLEQLNFEIRTLRQEAKENNPEYANYLERFDELFTFEYNDQLFNRMKNNAEVKYADDPEKLADWYRLNTIDLPKGEWYEKIADLYEQKKDLFGENLAIKELMDERRSILSKHKVNGKFSPKFLSDMEVDRLNDIDNELELTYEALKKTSPKLEPEQYDKLSDINIRLNELVSKQLNENYKYIFDKKFSSLKLAEKRLVNVYYEKDIALSKNEDVSDINLRIELEEQQFRLKEQDFKTWFDKHHKNKYRTIREGFDPESLRQPNAYNYESLPALGVREQYMDIGKPRSKYSIKKLKESSYNPDFLRSADGIPMPNNIILKDGSYIPNGSDLKNINPKYLELMRDPELFSFYNDMVNLFFDLQKKTEGRSLGYKAPGFAASAIENITRDGFIKSFEKNKSNWIDKHVKAYGSKQDYVSNAFGDLGGRIRNKFNEQLPEEMQSKDVIGSIIKWSTEAQMNVAMQEVSPIADSFIEYLRVLSEDIEKKLKVGSNSELTKKLSELNNVVEILEFERRKFIYGQADVSETAGNRLLKKRINNMFAYTSFIRIGFDLANQTKNYLSGNVQTFIAAGNLKSDHYTRADLRFAKGQVYGKDGFISNFFKDYGKLNDLSESTMIYRYYNPLQKDILKYHQEVTGNKSRKVKGKLTDIQDFGFLLQDKGDTEIGVTVMYSVMNHYTFPIIERYENGIAITKLDVNGNDVTIPVHECYTLGNNGELKIRDDVKFTKEDENQIRNIIYSEIRRAQGNYSKSDMTKFEESIAGKLVFFFRKYLVPQLLNRFGYLRPNWEASEVSMGYWRAVRDAWKVYGIPTTMKHLLLGGFTDANKLKSFGGNTEMNDFYTRKTSQASRDMVMMGILSMLSYLLLSYVKKKDDDDEELSLLEGNAIRILWGVNNETASLMPIGTGQQDYIRNFTSITTYTREFNAVQKLGSHSVNLMFALMMNGGDEPDDSDSEYYHNVWKKSFYTKKAGAYEKGDPKIMKDFMDLTGIKNFRDLVDPNSRIDILKRNQ